jgi:hypothetical protein
MQDLGIYPSSKGIGSTTPAWPTQDKPQQRLLKTRPNAYEAHVVRNITQAATTEDKAKQAKDASYTDKVTHLLDSLSTSLASISAHIRGEKEEWGVKLLPNEGGWTIVASAEHKPFFEVEVSSEGTVHLRPLTDDATSDSSSSSHSKPAKRTFHPKYSRPLAKKPQFRCPLWRRDLNIQLFEEPELFSDLCTPSSEGHFNTPAELTGIWREGTKSWLEGESAQ